MIEQNYRMEIIELTKDWYVPQWKEFRNIFYKGNYYKEKHELKTLDFLSKKIIEIIRFNEYNRDLAA